MFIEVVEESGIQVIESKYDEHILYNYWLKFKNSKEFARFTGRRFPELIPCNRKQVVRRCQVCNPAEQQMDKSFVLVYASSCTIQETITFKDRFVEC